MSSTIRRNSPFQTDAANEHPTKAVQPRPALLHVCMLLSGFGTVFLGPVLPALAANAHTTDSGSGLFFTAQFAGAFLGGITTSRHLWLSLVRGAFSATLGFAGLGVCFHQHAAPTWDATALVFLGFGVGQMLTSTNLLAAQLYAAERGSALAKINFTWSMGALLSPFLLGNLTAHALLGETLFCLSMLFALACAATILPAKSSYSTQAIPDVSSRIALPLSSFAYFSMLLFLYGGTETSLSGWITTFGTRYGSGTLQTSSYSVTAIWAGITAGRALTPAILLKLNPRTVLRVTLLLSALFVAFLSQAHGAIMIIILASLLGLTLAPWFPLVLANLLFEGATASQTGTIIAVSGIGAAALPLLVGELSRAAHGLRAGILVPLTSLLLLLALSFTQKDTQA